MWLDAIGFICHYAINPTVGGVTKTDILSFDKFFIVNEEKARCEEDSSKVKAVSENLHQCGECSEGQKSVWLFNDSESELWF